MIKIIMKRVGQPAQVEDNDGELASMQALVGGFIQAVPLEEGLHLICDDEGKLKGYAPNVHFYNDDIICGDFLLSRVDDEGEAISVTEADIAKYVPKLNAGLIP